MNRTRIATFLVACLALAAAACGGSKSIADATPTATTAAGTASPAPATATTTAPTPSPTAQVIDGVTVTPLTAGEPVDFPKGAVFYVLSQCQACDVPPAALERVWRDLGGNLHTDRLFERVPGTGAEYITSVAISPGGQSIIVGVCGQAYCGGVGQIQPGARVTFHASNDGGITWKVLGAVDGGGWVMTAKDQPGGVSGIVKHVTLGPGGAGQVEYLTVPGNTVIEHSLTLDPSATTFDLGSNVVYRGPDRTSLWILQGGSAPWVNPKLPPTADVQDAIQFEGESPYHWGVTWVQDGGFNPPPPYFGLMSQREGTPARIFRGVPNGPGFLWTGGLAAPTSLALNAYLPGTALGVTPAPAGFPMVPALLDFETGKLHPIKELIARAITPTSTQIGDVTRIIATARGHFVAVKGAGDCLNLRANPTTSAGILGCFPDGVLLNHLGESTQADGVTWAHVATLSGMSGWASLEFLDLGAAGATVTGTQPAGVRSGDAAVDRVLDALASGDRARIIALMEWTVVGCVAQPIGIGSPPKCPDDVPAGTKVETLPGACSEGFYILKDSLTENVEFSLFKPQPLYAVWRKTVTNTEWASYDTIAEFGTPGGFATQVYIRQGHITGFSGCRANPAEDVKDVPPGDFLIRPR